MKSREVVACICGVLCLIPALFPGCTPTPAQDSTIAPADTVYVAVKQVVTVTRDKVRYVTRDRIVERAVPPEGSVTFDASRYARLEATRDSLKRALDQIFFVSVRDSSVVPYPAVQSIIAQINSAAAQLSSPEQSGLISIQRNGLCLRPLIGIGWNGDYDGFLGAKIAFWNAYGIAIGATSRQVGGGITRRLDFIPYVHNTEGILFYGFPFKSETSGLFAGVAVHL